MRWAALSDGAFALAQKKFSANAVKLSKPVTAITRDAKGVINLATAFARKAAKPSAPSSIITQIGAIELIDGAIAFRDRSNLPALTPDLQNIRFVAKDVSSAATSTSSSIPFEAGQAVARFAIPDHQQPVAGREQSAARTVYIG